MKLSFAISMQETSFDSVGKGDWKQNIDLMGEMGFDGVELAIKDPFSVDRKQLGVLLESNGLKLVAIGTGQAYFDDGISLSLLDETTRKKAVDLLKGHIDLAACFGPLVIIGLIRGRLREQGNEVGLLRHFETAMRELDSYAEKKDVNLIIEPINRYETDYLNNIEETVNFIEANQLKFTGILLDTFHMNIEEKKWDGAVSTSKKYLKHVHIADSNRWYPGYGHIDFSNLLKEFKSIEYNGFFSGEMQPLPDLKTALIKYFEFMRGVDLNE